MRIQLVVFGLFSALTITGVMTLTLQSNDTIPERGKSLQLSCLPSGNFTGNNWINWLKPNNERLSQCYAMDPACDDLSIADKSSYRVTKDSKGAYVDINSLSRDKDNGTWKCEYGNSIETATINIYIYTSPGGVHFQPLQPDKDLAVESLTLTCQIDNCCYPAPTIAWYYTTSTGETALYQGSSGILSGNTTTCTQSESSYTSTLQLNRGTTFMNNFPVTTKFVCGIQHPTFKGDIKYSLYSKNVTFAVNLTVLTLKDSGGNALGNKADLLNGTTVTLICVTSPSHPTATVNWYIENLMITSGINNLIISGNSGLKYVVSKLTLTPSNTDHHNKKIYCKAYTINTNDVIQTDSLMFVKVQVRGITLYDSSSELVSSNLSVVDGTPTTLHCETTPSRPAAIISWYKGDFVINNNVITTNRPMSGLDITRSSMTLTPSNSDHGQSIYCQAYNINPVDKVNSIRTTLHVTVYVNTITMSPSGSPFIFLERQEKIIQCVTNPSRPRPQVRWWLGTEQVLDKITESESSSVNLIVTTSEISLTLNRSYTHQVLYCDATVSGQQTWISSTKSVVTVLYVPDVRVNISGSTVVGFTAVLMCTAQGEPPQYTFHPWIHRVGQTEIRRLNGVNTDSNSILTLSNTSIQDMGSYICTVDNTITGLDVQLYQTGDTSVYVQGRPVIDKIQTPFTGEPFKPASIRIPFYSHTSIQKPTFYKQIGSQEILNTSDISSYIQPSNITMMFYNKKVTIAGYVAILQFSNLTETDFGNYTLKLTNDKGSETMQFEFIASVPPSMPKNFFFFQIGDGFVVFGLEKGYNGGHQQTFVVEYRPSGNPVGAWSTVYKINEDNLDNPSSNGTYYIKIPKIQDGQYEFRVYAQNEKGNSSAVEDVHAEIKTAHNATTAPSVLQRSDIECQTTYLKIFIPKHLVPANGTATWRDSGCVVHSNGTHFVDSIGLRDCGTTLTFESDSVVFENELIFHKNGTLMQNGNNIVSYGSDYEFAIPVKCVYPRNSNISTSYIPIVQQVKILERRNGQLDLTMRQYEAEDYRHPVPFNAYPRQVPLNNEIFIRLDMENNVTGLGLSADNCFATSSPSPVDPNWYQLISSGCPVNNAKIHPSGTTDVKFSFHAFNFRQNTSGIVYVHCQVSICLDTDPACVVGCMTRKKRSASAREGSITSNLISTGPFIMTTEEGGLNTSTVVAAVSIAVAVIATVVAVIGWTKKSKKAGDI